MANKNATPSRAISKNKITGNHTPHSAPDWWEKETKGLKALAVCPKCHALYYDKHWHSWADVKDLTTRLRNEGVRDELCTECRWTKSAKGGAANYEGEVVLSGWKTTKEKTEMLQLVRNVGKRALARDPEDQVIRIEDLGKQVRILTTENQLALSIGKQIDRAHKGGKLDIKFSHGDSTTRIKWVGPGEK